VSILAWCLVAHALLARLIASPWWVPDLTLVGLVVGVGLRPRHWLIASGVAGCFMMAWAVRFPAQVALGYVLCGTLVRLVARRWDMTDGRIQGCLVIALSSLLTLGLLGLERLWSWPLLACAAVRVAVTGLSLLLVQRLLRRASPLSV
jgi:hypothetical protein